MKKKSKFSRRSFLGISSSAVTGMTIVASSSLPGFATNRSEHNSRIAERLRVPAGPTAETLRICLAQISRGKDIPHGVEKIEMTLAECSRKGVDIVCFPETYLPGLRGGSSGSSLPPPDKLALEKALDKIQAACRNYKVAAIVGMEWVSRIGLENRAFVISADGVNLGYQTKNQITPGGEEAHYSPEDKRRLFAIKGVPFGIVICHEGWRYPETVRWAAVRGAKIVFQPQVTGSNSSRASAPKRWANLITKWP